MEAETITPGETTDGRAKPSMTIEQMVEKRRELARAVAQNPNPGLGRALADAAFALDNRPEIKGLVIIRKPDGLAYGVAYLTEPDMTKDSDQLAYGYKISFDDSPESFSVHVHWTVKKKW